MLIVLRFWRCITCRLIPSALSRYTWKYTWGSFTKNKAYQLHLDDLDDIHCPITGPYDVNPSIVQTQNGPEFVKTATLRQEYQLTLPVQYNSDHPCIEIDIPQETDCHIAMLPGPNAAECPELRTANQDGAAVDYSFIIMDSMGNAITSAPLNVMGSAVAGHTLSTGKYTVVPFNHSNKEIAGVNRQHSEVGIELIVFTTIPVKVTGRTIGLSEYTQSLREYIVSRGSPKEMDRIPVSKFTRHDGHGTLIWVDNLSPQFEAFHVMQFQIEDGIAMNRVARGTASKKYEDVIPAMTGKLVMVAWSSLATGESISQANTLAHSNGWKAAKSFDAYCIAHSVKMESTPIFTPIPGRELNQ